MDTDYRFNLYIPSNKWQAPLSIIIVDYINAFKDSEIKSLCDVE